MSKRVVVREIPGIVAGRANAALTAGGGVLFSAMFMGGEAAIVGGGILGIAAAATAGVVASSINTVKKNVKNISHNDFGGAEVEIDKKDITRVFFGLSPSTERIYVNKGGLVPNRASGRYARLTEIVKPLQFSPDAPEAKLREEITNYIVMKNGKIVSEQVISPTSLLVWDNAFAQAGGKVTWGQPQGPAPQDLQMQSMADKATDFFRKYFK